MVIGSQKDRQTIIRRLIMSNICLDYKMIVDEIDCSVCPIKPYPDITSCVYLCSKREVKDEPV